MKSPAIALSLALLVSACSGGDGGGTGSPAVGSDVDEHGCKASAGYSWCAKTQQCERPWELAKQQGFENSEAAYKAFCEE
ncbi:hypothetical protein [Halioglobus sp. HI00S01]|uniref:hypothetical protein n=1 Tax=Halioglobus sp. HI00S01 TaxID=1822214 RepID=UPI000824C7BB|nr:hypothetical protein [Halioglobus sp. HI00S01]